MIMHRADQTLAIRALKSAAPYIRMYKGKTFVVKAGGGVFADGVATRVLVEQIAILHHFGVRVVLVHGGGPQLTELSAALGAEKLILCTGAPGILGGVDDPGSLISYTDLRGLKRLRDEGRIADGMLPKAKAIEEALRGGVRRVHVVSYLSPEGILAEVFTNEGTGTLIVPDINGLSPAEQQSAP